MVGQVLARRGVSEDGEAIAVERDPLGKLAESIARNGQLAAAARVRPHRLQMKMPDGHSEALLRRGGKRLGAFDLCGIVIDVGVKVLDRWFGHDLL